MLQFFILFKNALMIFGPLIAIEFYMRVVYHLGLSKVVVWWFKDSHTLDENYGIPLLIGLFFSYLAVFAALALFIQMGSNFIIGEKHSAVYVGHDYKDRSLFVPADDVTREPKPDTTFVEGFNYSFNNVLTETIFIRDKGTDILGGTLKSYSLGSFISYLLLLITFLIPLLVVVHFYAYPVTANIPNSIYDANLDGMESFDLMLKSFGFGAVKLLFTFFGLLVLYFFTAVKQQSKESYGPQIYNLPASIYSGNIIEGQPIHVEYHKSQRSNSSGSYSDYDNGYRTIVFKFEKDFPTPVYVSTYYDSREKPGLGDLAYQNSQSNTKMKLKILDDLSIEVVDETTKSSN